MNRFAMGLALFFLGSITGWAVPGKPSLQAPATGDIAERRPVFKWTAAADTTHYLLRITRGNGSTYLEKWTTKTSWTPPADIPEGSYAVRVVGFDGAVYGKWSAVRQFRRIFSPALASLNGIRRDGGNIDLVAGAGIAIEPSASNLAVVISAVGTGDYELADLSVTTAKLADYAVTTAKLSDNSVNGSKIADGTVGNADLAAGAAIADTKLAAITTAGKVANSATTATSANTASAIVARDASGNFSAGAIAAASFSGGGSALTNLNASQLASGTVPDARLSAAMARSNQVWQLGGNTGTTAGVHFLGTSDNRPLEMKVNNLRVVRLSDNGDGTDADGIRDGAPSIVMGSPSNWLSATAVGSVIGGGGATNRAGTLYPNSISSDYCVIGGGCGNTIGAFAYNSTIHGGASNAIHYLSPHAVIGGGYANTIQSNASSSVIGGGYGNTLHAQAHYAVIAGGGNNVILTNADHAVIAGGENNVILTNADHAVIAGGENNVILTNANHAFIGSGKDNTIAKSYAVIGGGLDNQVLALYSVISGGRENTIDTNTVYAIISAGYQNNIQPMCNDAVIGGGYDNAIHTNSAGAVISGGQHNTIETNGVRGVIGGGYNNTILSSHGTIPGGAENAAGQYGFAAGFHAKALHTGSFVWGDSNPSDVSSTNNNSVTMRASGGYRLFSSSSTNAGVALAHGGTAWAVLSDRNQKKDFVPVDGREVLEALAGIPITRWHYLWETDGDTPHIGPMAQDFIPAFFPGRDDTRITTQEADGVALAAIQGLNAKMEEEIALLRAENELLKARLDRLEKALDPAPAD